jgi:hypothetical protein
VSDGCKIKKTDNIYSVGYNTQQDTIKIYCEGGAVATVPSSPTNVVATPGNGQVSLSWTAPNDGGSAITDYKIEYSSNGFLFNEFSHAASSNTSITVTGLVNGTLYIFRVSATNAVGTGNPSGFSNAVRPFTTPSAPSITSLTRVAGSGVAISISWSAPSSNGGSPIQEYKIEYSNNSGVSWSFKTVSANILSTIVDNLENGQSYIFRIVAINAAGATFSSNSSPITPATTPSSPTNVVGTTGDSQISLTWSAPSSNGGLAVTDYTIQYKGIGEENWQTFSDGTSTNTSTIVTGLTNGQSYIFRVVATNAVGDSIESPNSSEITPGTIPDAPTNLNATAGDGFASLFWSAGEDNGYAIIYYTVRYSSNNGSTWEEYETTTSTTSLVINQLNNNGTSYIFQVKATNGIGDSEYSSSSNSVTPLSSITCTTGPISHDYVLAFIDEAHPLYVVGTGNVGSLWGADVLYYNNRLSNFPSCATILFDVDTPFVARGSYKGQSISSDPFYIFPTGVNSSQYTQCKLPIDNITGIARPSGGIEYNGSTNAIGSISADSFATGIVNAIETFWGSDFWPRMTGSFNSIQNRPCKLWITRGHTVSLGSGILTSGIEIFSNYVINNKNWTQNNISTYINECGERYLGWITDVIQSQGNQDSCRNMVKPPNVFNIIQEVINNNACANNPGDRLVKFYFDPPDYPDYPYPSTCSGTEALDDRLEPNFNPYYEGLSLRINSLFSCSGILNSAMVSEFSDPSNNNNKLAEWNFYSYADAMSQNPANRSFASRVYEGKVFLTYENSLPYITVGAVAWDDRFVEPSYSVPGTYYVWKSPVPLDIYGVPNGTVEESSPIFSGNMDDDVWILDNYDDYKAQILDSLGVPWVENFSAIEPGTGIPQFPNIRFQSSPCFTLSSIPGSECISINS